MKSDVMCPETIYRDIPIRSGVKWGKTRQAIYV
jgi:hypothetical protein